MNHQLIVPQKDWPKEILVDASRLAMGIWGETVGDIHAAYSADTFPKIRAFEHEGRFFTNCGGMVEQAMDCYPLIPETLYQSPEPTAFSYEGRAAIYLGQRVKLGPRVTFVARDRTPEEWALHLRRQYAYGGCFAAGKSYREVLQSLSETSQLREGEKMAIESELSGTDLPNTQKEMVERLSSESLLTCPERDRGMSQLTLPGV